MMGYRDDGMRKLSFSEIECITVLDRKVMAIDGNGIHYRIQDRLRDLEEILPSYFIRINKSTLANEHRIARFDAVFSGGVDAVFQCGYREYVSRRCFSEIRRRFEGK
jgi:DNA-binding LytR/AlgR family response regulator